MANKDKLGNIEIGNEERIAPGSDRTGSGSQDVQSDQDSRTGKQPSTQQTERQNDRQNDRSKNM